MIDGKEIELARKGLESALQKGAQKVRVTLNKNIMDLAGTLNGELDKTSHCLDRSLSINLMVDGRYGSFSTNRIEDTDSFLDKAIDKATLSSLLWAATGVNRPDGRMTAPTAVNAQDISVYVADKRCD